MSEDILLEEPPKADYREFYGRDPSQFVDLFLPRKKKAAIEVLPIIFFVHGGFWKSEYDLSHAGHLCKALSERLEVAVLNVEYRRIGSSGGGWPYTFLDVGAAADFLPSVSDRHNFDHSRAIIMGHSAGGHLALWVAMRSKIKNKNSILLSKDQLPFKFQASISLAGVVNLEEAFKLNLGGGIVKDLIGGTPKEFPARYAEASPIELLMMPDEAPIVLIHGTDDRVVPFSLSKEFAERALRVDSKNVRLIALEKTAHFELIDPRTKQFSIVQSEVGQILAKL
jgi:acetyl esterase/lipase